jgi:hypothetical protein
MEEGLIIFDYVENKVLFDSGLPHGNLCVSWMNNGNRRATFLSDKFLKEIFNNYFDNLDNTWTVAATYKSK